MEELTKLTSNRHASFLFIVFGSILVILKDSIIIDRVSLNLLRIRSDQSPDRRSYLSLCRHSGLRMS